MPDTNETALEQTFSDLAYSHLRDKSQALLDYLVGFQMLKQEDDGKRAIGIFGFEIDDDYYYAPIFFLNGEIRGLDSLYSVKSDLFVPITEDWVNTLINRRQVNLGEKDTRTRSERGIHVPNYTRLKVIPGGTGSINLKLAADTAEALLGAPRDITVMDLPSALASTGLTQMFKEAMDNSRQLKRAFSKFYGLIDLYELPEPQVKTAAEEAVVLINSITDEGVNELSDEQRENILEGGTVVIDNRPEISKSQLFTSETKERLENPSAGSLYDVLWADGTVSVALVANVNALTNETLVYCTEKKMHCIVPSRCVWCLRRYSNDELKAWLGDNAVKASDVKTGQSGVFVSFSGEATGGFNISEVVTGIDDITVCTVESSYRMDARGDYSFDDERGNNGDPKSNMYHDFTIGGTGDQDVCSHGSRPKDPNDRVQQVLVPEAGGACPRYSEKRCIVNDKCFYFLKLNTFKLKGKNDYQKLEQDKPRYDVLLSKADFGDYSTVREALCKEAEDLKVWTDGNDMNIKVGSAEDVRTFGNESEALRYGIVDLGLNEADTRAFIKDASRQPTTYQYLASAKTAAELLTFPEIQDTDLGGFMSSFHRQQTPYETVEKSQPDNNREFYGYESPFGGGTEENGTFSVVEDASNTGQKDVFDAAALGSLIKNHNPTDLVDRFLPTITSGMDRIGRMLFLIYWHYTDFEDRYGENDLSEFIDNLRAVFEQLGDVIIFAKKRTLAGDPEHYGIGAAPMMEESD